MSTLNGISIRSYDEITFENKFGILTKCREPTSDFYKGAMNIKELIKDLKDNLQINNFFFYLQKYTNNLTKGMVLLPPYDAEKEESVPYTYNDLVITGAKIGLVEVKTVLSVALNERACYVDVQNPGFIFKLDPVNEEMFFEIRFAYKDSLDKREYNLETSATNDFTVKDKYEGIIIKTKIIKDLLALSNDIGHRTFIENSLKEIFLKKLKLAKTGSELKFLYENAPDFVLKELLNVFTTEQLWKHVELLTAYDDRGKLSWFTDGSGALINVFKAFGNSSYLMTKFTEDPAFVKRIFNNLDGSSEINGIMISNKMAFATLINACVITNSKDIDKKAILNKTFYYGDGYSIDGDFTSWFSDEKNDEFFLKQLKTVKKKEKLVFYAEPIPSVINSEKEVEIPEVVDAEEGKMYHPLEMVKLIDYTADKPTPKVVPVIFIKALAEEKEKQIVETNIRIGFDILAIVLGAVALATTANPGLLALALADIGLATTDVGIQAYRDEIVKMEGGEAFLETWEKIYMVGGVLLAGPALIETVLVNGARLLKLAKTVTSANFLKTCLLKVLLEIEIANFTKNTVKFFETEQELTLATSGVLNNFKVAKLYQQGAFVVKGSIQTAKGVEEQIAIIYKGEAIAVANKGEFVKATKDIIKNINNEKKLVEILEGLWKLIPKLTEDKRFWTCFNEAGTELRWANETLEEMLAKIEKQITDGKQAEKLMKERGAIFKEMNTKQQQFLTAGLEAEVAKEFLKYDKLLSVSNDVFEGKRIVGEIDGLFNKYYVETKYSVAGDTNTGKFLDQFKKYIDSLNKDFINVQEKKVVLFIKEFSNGGHIEQSVLKTLQQSKEIEVIIITDFKQIKKLY